MYSQFNPYSINIKAIKDYFKSGKVLAAGVLYILMMISGAITAVLTYVNSYDLVGKLVEGRLPDYNISLSGIGGLADQAAQGAVTTSIAPLIIESIFLLLTAAGFIMLNRRSRTENASPKAGVVILFVLSIIGLAATILPSLLLTVILIMMISGSAYVSRFLEGFPGGAALPIAVCAVMLGVLVFILFYAVQQLRYYNSVRKSLGSVELKSKGAKAFGVMNIILAVIEAAVLVMIFIGFFMDSKSMTSPMISIFVFTVLTVLFELIITILNASIALGYKKHIDKLKFGYNGASYQGLGEDNYPSAPVREPARSSAEPKNNADVDMGKNPYSDLFTAQKEPSVTAVSSVESFEDLFTDSAPEASAGEAAFEQSSQINRPSESPAPITCPACGSPLPADSKFCNHCGTRL